MVSDNTHHGMHAFYNPKPETVIFGSRVGGGNPAPKPRRWTGVQVQGSADLGLFGAEGFPVYDPKGPRTQIIGF